MTWTPLPPSNWKRKDMAFIHETTKITATTKMAFGWSISIGDFVFIHLKHLVMLDGSQIAPHAILSGGGEVLMGRYSVIGFGAHLITGTDTPKGKYMCEAAEPEERHIVRGKIILKEGAYIGSNAIICITEENPVITIGENSVIGAFSYIDKNIPDNVTVHPKQELIIKERDLDD